MSCAGCTKSTSSSCERGVYADGFTNMFDASNGCRYLTRRSQMYIKRNTIYLLSTCGRTRAYNLERQTVPTLSLRKVYSCQAHRKCKQHSRGRKRKKCNSRPPQPLCIRRLRAVCRASARHVWFASNKCEARAPQHAQGKHYAEAFSCDAPLVAPAFSRLPGTIIVVFQHSLCPAVFFG